MALRNLARTSRTLLQSSAAHMPRSAFATVNAYGRPLAALNQFGGAMRKDCSMSIGVRYASTFFNSLKQEASQTRSIEDCEAQITSILEETSFQLKSASYDKGALLTLKNGNAIVTLNPAELERSDVEGETAVPFILTIETKDSQLTVACIARRGLNDEDEQTEYAGGGNLEVEEICVEPIGGYKDDKISPFSPAVGELDEELIEAMFDYLADHGVDDGFADAIARVAEEAEEILYVKWLNQVKDFVKKEEGGK